MLKQRVMIIDEDKESRKKVESALSREGFVPIGADSAKSAFKKMMTSKPDMIITELQLSDKDGFEVCRAIRSDPTTRYIPLIFLTNQALDSHKISGLEMGADDYITKPFNQAELMARIKAVLRRMVWADKKEVVLQDENMVINYDKHSVTIESRAMDLSPKEFSLLYLLLHNRGRVMTRSELSETIWGQEYFGNTRTVDVHIGRLRRKLDQFGGKIKTVERIGYVYE